MTDTVNILMIDDDEEDFLLVEDIIKGIDHFKYSIEWVDSFEEGQKRILERKHHIYLVDFRMGVRTGDEFINEAILAGCEEPLILLTGQQDAEIDRKAQQAGAADFLVKGLLSSTALESAIRYSLAHSNHLKEIKRLAAELENKVKERTQDLQKTILQLEETRKNLDVALSKEKELNDLKSGFVSMASHEFRTPLATILSSLSLISIYGQQRDFEKQLKHITRIKTAIENLTDLTNDVLSLTKLEEGGMSVCLEQLNISELVLEVKQEMQALAKEGQELFYSHDGESEIILDKKILKHIFLNLISNAIKFSPPAKPIEIETRITENRIHISVKDNGIGISEADQKHLFERFFRAQNAGTIQGTGLGLNIMSKYVEMLSGKIEFKSKLNEGTVFHITFPRPVNTAELPSMSH